MFTTAINYVGSAVGALPTLPNITINKQTVRRGIFLTGFFLFFFVLLYAVVIYKLYYLLDATSNPFVWLYSLIVSTYLLSRFLISFFYDDSHSWKLKGKKYPGVTFIITCKNEEDSIEKTIDACFASKYNGKMEVIAVDDGSTDKTLSCMKKSKRKYGKSLNIISFGVNKGKREAMAEGVLAATHDIVIYVDSDSFVAKDGVKHLVEHFMADEKIGAVAGNSLVANASQNTLTKMQSARYGVSFDILKSSESVFGAVTCCPGCFSGYRKAAILGVMNKWRYQRFLGTQSTFGDDRSLTNFILRSWKVVYCRKAMAETIAPDQYKKFFKQQFRWKKSWVREGFNAGAIMWKKHPIASVSYYTNLIIPVFAPVIAFNALFTDSILKQNVPVVYIAGLFLMSLLFGLYYQLVASNKYWWYIVPFTIIHTGILVWQMPWAILKVRDTGWGTR